jgi:hypothetical protein
MSRADNIARILRAVELARPYLPSGVSYVDGWRERGRDGLRPRGIINHTTEDARPLSWAQLMPILRDGHGAIAGNSICQFAIRQSDAKVVVIAAGLSWHCGEGGWNRLTNNASMLGTEYQRGQGETLHPAMLEAGLVWDWALTRAFDIPVANICEHREWAPGRKTDRRLNNTTQVSGDAWRRDLADMIRKGGPTRPSRAFTTGDRGPDVLRWNRTLDLLFPAHPASGKPTDRFTKGTAQRTLLVFRYGELTAADPAAPRVGDRTRGVAERMLREPWAGMRVVVKTAGLRYYGTPGWHPDVQPAGTGRQGLLFGGGIVRKLKVDDGEQYEVFPLKSKNPLYITASTAHVELV